MELAASFDLFINRLTSNHNHELFLFLKFRWKKSPGDINLCHVYIILKKITFNILHDNIFFIGHSYIIQH